MMLSFGMFPFEIGTAPFQELARSRSWRYGRTPRFGAREASQFLGAGDDEVTLSGAIIPGLAGTFWSIETLAQIADEGLAWPLVTGTGSVLGHYVVDKLEHKESTFLVDGLPRKGDFTISLHRVADDARQQASTGSLSLGLDGVTAAAAGLGTAVSSSSLPVVGDRIQQQLGALNMTAADLASTAGFAQSTIEALVSGNLAQSALDSVVSTLTTADLGILAQALGVSPDWLLGNG